MFVACSVNNAVNEATSRCVKFCCWMLWHLKCIEQSHYVSGPTFDSLHKNLVWWAVTQKTHIPVKIERWAHALGWVLAWDNTIVLCAWLVMLIVLIIRTVGRLSQSKAVTFNWFMGPQNRFPCPNIPV